MSGIRIIWIGTRKIEKKKGITNVDFVVHEITQYGQNVYGVSS